MMYNHCEWCIEMIDPIISIGIAIIGIILNIYGYRKISGVMVFRFFRRSMIIKMFSNLLFILGWECRIYGYEIFYAFFFTIAGILILIIAIIIFWGVHKEIYVERTEFVIAPLYLFFVLNGTIFTLPRVRTLMIGAFGMGLVFMASTFAIYNCYNLYRKRKGGAIIWLMIAIYALMILLINVLGLILTFYEIIETLSFQDVLSIHLSSIILPDLIAFYSAYYYNRRIKPLLVELE